MVASFGQSRCCFSRSVLRYERFGLAQDFSGSGEQSIAALDCFDGALDHVATYGLKLNLIHRRTPAARYDKDGMTRRALRLHGFGCSDNLQLDLLSVGSSLLRNSCRPPGRARYV